MAGVAALNELIEAGTIYTPSGCDGSTSPPSVVELGTNHRAVVSILPLKVHHLRIVLSERISHFVPTPRGDALVIE
eukprot:1394732-Amorphochlora_amoeboformis.AAC.1